MSGPGRSQSAWAELANGVGSSSPGVSISIRLLLVFAHPDDETIAASMLMSHSKETHLVYLTDGAPRDRRFWSPDATGVRQEYARLRRQEGIDAARCAGIGEGKVTWLGAVDQEGTEAWETLTRSTAELIMRKRPDAAVTHAYEGGHPDHDAAALITRLAVQNAADYGVHCELMEVPLYHAQGGHFVPGRFVDSLQDGGPGPEELIFRLSPKDLERKRKMLRSHHSQWRVLESFPLELERVRPAPMYDFTKPPHAGKLWYECLGWPMTGARWRQIAAGALTTMRR
jgi:LmbE family N-acetylglucosaminyl deacetylase